MSSLVSEPNAPSGSTWLRWGLVILLILAGIVLALVLGSETEPVVQPETVIR
ncbi:MAG TPA: hypothetical protein VGA78_17260 [Gemmatimonadales bacterium]|jgi:hypothetical protein